MDPKGTKKFVPNPSIKNKNKLKLPFVQPTFMVDQLPGEQAIEIMQHCYANEGIPFSSECRRKLWFIVPRNVHVTQAVQERRPTKFEELCDAASAARKVLKEQEAKEMQKKKDSGASSSVS